MPPRSTSRRTAVTGALVALLAITGCGSEEPSTPAAPAAPVGSTLLATVGTEDSPEAFEIALTTEDGEPVRALSAGEYTIEVSDFARSHNFVLTGPGVQEATSVSEVEQVTFQVSLEPGSYDYVCDPHPSMSGSFEVTA